MLPETNPKMSNLEGEALDSLVSAFEAGTAGPEQQQQAAGLLKPASVIITQLTEDLLQALMFEDPKTVHLLELVVMTKHGIMTLSASSDDTVH